MRKYILLIIILQGLLSYGSLNIKEGSNHPITYIIAEDSPDGLFLGFSIYDDSLMIEDRNIYECIDSAFRLEYSGQDTIYIINRSSNSLTGHFEYTETTVMLRDILKSFLYSENNIATYNENEFLKREKAEFPFKSTEAVFRQVVRRWDINDFAKLFAYSTHGNSESIMYQYIDRIIIKDNYITSWQRIKHKYDEPYNWIMP